MQMINDMFPGYLSKFGAKMVDSDVVMEFVITHVSKNEPDQNFLNNFSEEFNNNVNRCMTYPEWDNIKFTTVIPLDVKFDVMEMQATLQTIKITQKETAEDVIVKYDLTFQKKQEEGADTHFATYLNYKEEDDEGKKHLVEYDVEMSKKSYE